MLRIGIIMDYVVYMFLLFFIYAVIGYLIEISFVSFNNKKFVFSRGYLIGPYLPIFGFGSLMITLFLSEYCDNIITLFAMAMFLCCILEYFTSLIMEKVFGLRWWDYSNKKYNLNGRICLETGAMFGLGGVFIVKIFSPMLAKLFTLFSKKFLLVLAIILFSIMVLDFIVSTIAVIRLKIDSMKYLRKDATKIIKEEVKKSLQRYRYLHNRLFKAFPEILRKDTSFLKIKEITEKRKKYKK